MVRGQPGPPVVKQCNEICRWARRVSRVYQEQKSRLASGTTGTCGALIMQEVPAKLTNEVELSTYTQHQDVAYVIQHPLPTAVPALLIQSNKPNDHRQKVDEEDAEVGRHGMSAKKRGGWTGRRKLLVCLGPGESEGHCM